MMALFQTDQRRSMRHGNVSGCFSKVFAVVLVLGIGAGLWFGGSWLEQNEWESKYDTLESTKDSLEAEASSWQAKYDSLQEAYEQLESMKDSLEPEASSWQAQYDSLQQAYEQLDEDYGALQMQNQDLADQRDSLQDSYDALRDWYSSMRETVNLRHGFASDKKAFVMPDDPAVAATVETITGGFSEDVNQQWADVKRMYDWVADNIEYSYDSPVPLLPSLTPPDAELSWRHDYWRMPNETIEDETGDCEDMAVLLTTMLLNYFSTEEYPCWAITWGSQGSAHVAVAIPVEGDELAILDPAANYYTGRPYSLRSEDVSTAVSDWLGLWPEEPGIRVTAAFSDTVYETFGTTNQFVQWVLAE